MFDFKDHAVLVTGAGAGIGLGIAQAFHGAGARVALGDLREPGLAQAAEKLGRSERVFTHALDVRDGKSVDAFVQAAERAIGPLTVAVANAGGYPNSPGLDMTIDEWNRGIQANLRGVVLTCQAGSRRMVPRGSPGKLMTISSGAYNSVPKEDADYCAS